MKDILWIFLGGGIGSILRFGANKIFENPKYYFLPTLFVNLIGSFLIGCFIAWLMKNPTENNQLKLFLVTGICGGFTTFSALSMESFQLIKEGKFLLMMVYVAASVLFGIFMAAIGYSIFK